MKHKITVLIVDDEPAIREVLKLAFQTAHCHVIEAGSAEELFEKLDEEPIDLITLDLRLGGGEGEAEGLDLAEKIRRRKNIPIIMITGASSPFDRASGLVRGADDYITKPFHIAEVLLRVRNVLERYEVLSKPTPAEADTLGFGPGDLMFDHCVLDLKRRRLLAADQEETKLTEFEFQILKLFLEHPDRVLSRDDFMRMLRGRDWSPLDRTIDGHIARLRRKLEQHHDDELIKSVRGVGYVFVGQVHSVAEGRMSFSPERNGSPEPTRHG